ncbi:MAG: hypothetical protein QOF98_1530 [Streptomyces sp.]|nr:hypothetical protein [Streptomyces sp.]
MLARRMLMFVAVLFAITALAAAFAPPPPRTASSAPSIAPAAPANRSQTVNRTLDVDTDAPPPIIVRQGDLLHLEVRGAELDSVELQGLAGVRPLGPQAVAVFDVLTTKSGLYPVVLTSTGKPVATIDVTPPPREGLAPAGPLIHRTRDT